MSLCLLAFTLSLFIGMPQGMIAMVMRGKQQDTVISTFALVGFSILMFLWALLLILFLLLHINWILIYGYFNLLYQVQPITSFAIHNAWLSDSPYRSEIGRQRVVSHMTLPVAAVAVAPTTKVVRMIRISTDDVLNKKLHQSLRLHMGYRAQSSSAAMLLHDALPPIIPKL
jgi:cationic peptide transport system permease protein